MAVYLREIVEKLDADGDLEFTAGGESTAMAVPERLQFAVDLERGPAGPGPSGNEG